MTLYIKTTNDKYELPLIVEDSYHVLAAKMGLKPKTVANMCCTGQGGYHKVKLEKGEDLE